MRELFGSRLEVPLDIKRLKWVVRQQIAVFISESDIARDVAPSNCQCETRTALVSTARLHNLCKDLLIRSSLTDHLVDIGAHFLFSINWRNAASTVRKSSSPQKYG